MNNVTSLCFHTLQSPYPPPFATLPTEPSFCSLSLSIASHHPPYIYQLQAFVPHLEVRVCARCIGASGWRLNAEQNKKKASPVCRSLEGHHERTGLTKEKVCFLHKKQVVVAIVTTSAAAAVRPFGCNDRRPAYYSFGASFFSCKPPSKVSGGIRLKLPCPRSLLMGI